MMMENPSTDSPVFLLLPQTPRPSPTVRVAFAMNKENKNRMKLDYRSEPEKNEKY